MHLDQAPANHGEPEDADGTQHGHHDESQPKPEAQGDLPPKIAYRLTPIPGTRTEIDGSSGLYRTRTGSAERNWVSNRWASSRSVDFSGENQYLPFPRRQTTSSAAAALGAFQPRSGYRGRGRPAAAPGSAIKLS
jgi:hypothetical protein